MKQTPISDRKEEKVQIKTVLIVGSLLLLTLVNIIDRLELQGLKYKIEDMERRYCSSQPTRVSSRHYSYQYKYKIKNLYLLYVGDIPFRMGWF